MGESTNHYVLKVIAELIYAPELTSNNYIYVKYHGPIIGKFTHFKVHISGVC